MASGRRVLVTGAAGFLGSHIAERLAASGSAVLAVDAFVGNYARGIKLGNLAEMKAAGSSVTHVVEVDLRDAAATVKLLQGFLPDVVLHCAALAGVRRSVEDPVLYAQHNLIATINVLNAMQVAGCAKLVFASSSSVYGSDADVPFTEDQAAVRPVSPYAATKRSAELFLHTFSDLYGLDYMALRFFTVYGPRQRPDLAIHKFTAAILQGQPITMNGDGLSSRDYTHVDDIVDGVMRAVEHVVAVRGVREIVNLGSSSPVLLKHLVSTIEKACDREAIIIRGPDQLGDVPRTYADVSKAGRLLGYEPRRELVEGIADFVEWWKSRFLASATSA
ncbi:MAG TPA: NAD-dependent epimerase/dehydratase family protein [Demequina sp.]|nr:NAD-dependent epimerase/dehydratase family protein [Demequina sp.]